MSVYGVSGGVTVCLKKIYDIKNGVTRKLSKGYVIENGLTKKIYSGLEFGYTGTYTTQEITKDGKPYTLYTMTNSGVLTLGADAEYWMCGGGGGGRRGQGWEDHFQTVKDFLGVGGGGGYVKNGTLNSGQHVITIGAGGDSTLDSDKDGSATTIVSNSLTIIAGGGFCNGDGGSGGGAGVSVQITTADGDEVYDNAVDGRYHGDPGTGAGVSTYPFGMTTLKAHSAGGGSGGAFYYKNGTCHRQKGNAGGGNGSDGGATTSRETGVSNTTYAAGGNGGTYGGGTGGRGQKSNGAQAGTAATFYGSGGGGGGSLIKYGTYSNTAETCGSGGAGYQGVFYLLIPAA